MISSQHPDNPENSQIVYRQPLFSIQLGAVAISQSPEDKQAIDRLEGTYITGITPLTEEPINLDEK